MLRLYSFVPLGMSFPFGFCIPFVPVCTLTPFGEYNTIRRREEYKSTKESKCAPSIVLGARWPNGITTARAVAAAPVALSCRSLRWGGCTIRIVGEIENTFFPFHFFGKPHREQSNCEARESHPQCGLRSASTPALQTATISFVIKSLKTGGLKHRWRYIAEDVDAERSSQPF